MSITVKGILSFPNLFEPKSINNGAPKYTCSIVIKKSDPQVQTIKSAIDRAINDGFPSGFPAKGKLCLKKGDEECPEDQKMHDYVIVSCAAGEAYKPAIVDLDRKPIVDRSKVYAGLVCWFAINVYPYKMDMSKGIACGLNGVMVTEELGELGRLDSRPSVDKMFAAVGDVVVPSAPKPSVYMMTPKANGLTRDAYKAAGWSDEQLIQHGFMLPPGGIELSF